METKVGIAVAGTHGKTTTTGMIAWMLSQMGKDPSYIVGGIINQLDTNAHAGSGEYFVIEADEYDRMFLGLKPFISVITFMELDHPDCFPTLSDYYDAFSGVCIFNSTWRDCSRLRGSRKSSSTTGKGCYILDWIR